MPHLSVTDSLSNLQACSAIHRSLCCLVVPYGVDAVCKPMKTVFCQEQWNNLNQMSEPDQVYEKVHISDTGYWNQWCRTSLCNPAFCTILHSVLLGDFFVLFAGIVSNLVLCTGWTASFLEILKSPDWATASGKFSNLKRHNVSL